MPKLREKSRKEYVKKRKVEKLDMLEEDIRDDEYLYDDSLLTEREKRDREYRRKVLALAKAHSKAGDVEKVDRYYMPKEGEKVAQYDDEIIPEGMGSNYEQHQWEEAKLGTAVMKFGAKDAKDKSKVSLISDKHFKVRMIPNMFYSFQICTAVEAGFQNLSVVGPIVECGHVKF